MKHYTNTGTIRTIQRCKELNVGLLIVSPKWRDLDRWPYYAIDNGAYADWRAGRAFDGRAFTRVIDRALTYERRPDFVVLPDIVAGGQDSLALSLHWLERLPSELRYYLAVQDGMTADDVIPHLDRVEGLFVGGTMEWKLATSGMWCAIAGTHGKECHIGRIGTVRRMVWARRIGATSIDSTTWVQRTASIEYVSKARGQQCLEVGP